MKYLAMCSFLMLALVSCGPKKDAQAVKPVSDDIRERLASANIYEVNVRQFSPEGSFKGLQDQLPRLREMGVDVLWLMPIHPISKIKRKGGVGSHYAVGDYKATNPDYGTMEDFKQLVQEVHKNGMFIILDWVPNHTGWDNPWITEHPEWYTKVGDTISHPADNDGKLTDWYDVADLNYSNTEMRAAMVDAMKFWLTEADIDGFRCDVAGFVPDDFWTDCLAQLRKVKNIFMLAEWEKPELFVFGFDMCYGWEFHHVMKKIYKGEKHNDEPEIANANTIEAYLQRERKAYIPGYYKMHFTNNHDENSWNGTEKELFGDHADFFFTLAATLDGMPLIYNGQESNLDRRLAFFEKDSIDWKNYERTGFFKKRLALKHNLAPLGNGKAGVPSVRIPSNNDTKIYAFKRANDKQALVGIFNLSKEAVKVSLKDPILKGEWTDFDADTKITVGDDFSTQLEPWSYTLLVRN
jgi:alpha-amylase